MEILAKELIWRWQQGAVRRKLHGWHVAGPRDRPWSQLCPTNCAKVVSASMRWAAETQLIGSDSLDWAITKNLCNLSGDSMG